jgi:hypothetical protein
LVAFHRQAFTAELTPEDGPYRPHVHSNPVFIPSCTGASANALWLAARRHSVILTVRILTEVDLNAMNGSWDTFLLFGWKIVGSQA